MRFWQSYVRPSSFSAIARRKASSALSPQREASKSIVLPRETAMSVPTSGGTPPPPLRAALIEERTTKQSDSDGSKQHERRISNGRNSDRRFGVGLAWVKQTGYDAFGSGLAQVRRARRERSNNIKQMIPISVESFLGSPPEQAPDLYWRRQRSETAFRAPPGDASTPGWHPRP